MSAPADPAAAQGRAVLSILWFHLVPWRFSALFAVPPFLTGIGRAAISVDTTDKEENVMTPSTIPL